MVRVSVIERPVAQDPLHKEGIFTANVEIWQKGPTGPEKSEHYRCTSLGQWVKVSGITDPTDTIFTNGFKAQSLLSVAQENFPLLGQQNKWIESYVAFHRHQTPPQIDATNVDDVIKRLGRSSFEHVLAVDLTGRVSIARYSPTLAQSPDIVLYTSAVQANSKIRFNNGEAIGLASMIKQAWDTHLNTGRIGIKVKLPRH